MKNSHRSKFLIKKKSVLELAVSEKHQYSSYVTKILKSYQLAVTKMSSFTEISRTLTVELGLCSVSEEKLNRNQVFVR